LERSNAMGDMGSVVERALGSGGYVDDAPVDADEAAAVPALGRSGEAGEGFIRRVAGAPISWGICEVPGWGEQLPVDRVSARTVAIGQCRGTPRSLLIDKRGVPLDEVIEQVTAELTRTGGADPYRGVARAVVVEARR